MKYFLAIDLGASSGRHVVGHVENGEIILDEVYRFKTEMDDSPFDLVWDIPRLFLEIKNGIKEAFLKYPKIESLSIDTWGVDYVLLNGDKEIEPYYAYRNKRCLDANTKVHNLIPFDKLYEMSGIQFASYNSVYQLYDDLTKGRLNNATDYLMLPCYFAYKLTGKKTHEYTIESTTALLDPLTGDYNYHLIDRLGLPRKLFNEINKPGTLVGELSKEVASEVNGNCKVILAASHDTASAFESLDVKEDSIILSSGTWSLLGIKTKTPIINERTLNANYTNEGGVNYIRFLKNIMGMWIVNKVKESTSLTFKDIAENIKNLDYKETFDVNDTSLLSPKNMKEAVLKLLAKNPPKNDFELFVSIYRSLALAYAKAIDELENITNKKYNSIYIIGGGANNEYINKLVEEYTNKKVVALPIEATALGNVKMQIKDCLN